MTKIKKVKKVDILRDMQPGETRIFVGNARSLATQSYLVGKEMMRRYITVPDGGNVHIWRLK